ncbi:MAG TPA: glycosyltransferase family 4 protein [Candidatus Saccharimonadales bacterium]|nr:glycosyltransferase family 4 protein [Candidatus Saccharimonadales bacterium]
MKILWLSWKDISHPAAGGAERILHQLSTALVADGHEVTVLTAAYPGAQEHEAIDGVHIIRAGNNRYTHSFVALWRYVRKFRNKFDLVIEVVNTAPYFSLFFRDRAKRALFYHQLAREVWFHEAPAPLSHIGHYVLEPVATFLLGARRAPTITISESTKQDLRKFGFRDEAIKIIREAITLEPLPSLYNSRKFDHPTILSHGSIRAMKRTLDQVKAFEMAKLRIPNLQLKISGDATGDYGRRVLNYIENSPFSDDIQYMGRVTDAQKQQLMRSSHILTVTSIKEGWGLIVTEAASQGTPAVVYDVDGLRDSVRNGVTGKVTAPTPRKMADGIIEVFSDMPSYHRMRRAAWEWSQELTPDSSYKDFVTALEIA